MTRTGTAFGTQRMRRCALACTLVVALGVVGIAASAGDYDGPGVWNSYEPGWVIEGTALTPHENDIIPCGAKVTCTVSPAYDEDQRYDPATGESTLEPDTITYTWWASDGSFENGQNTGRSVVWIAPSTPTSYAVVSCLFQDEAIIPMGDTGYRDDENSWTWTAVSVAGTEKPVFHVKPYGTGTTGATWDDALDSVQDAIDMAASWYIQPAEVWVAAGDYNVSDYSGDTLNLADRVGVYGGFVGNESTAAERDARDWASNCTTLWGAPWEEDPKPVVTAAGVTGVAIDGFTITNGYSDNAGGGISCTDSSVLIAHNVIGGANFTNIAAGVYCIGGSPHILYNTICGNMNGGGTINGGVYCEGGYPVISHNDFYENHDCDITIVGGAPVVSVNTFASNGITPVCISCSGSATTVIAQNTIAGYQTSGVSCDGVSNALIGGNEINSCGVGIDCASSTVSVTRNMIEACASGIALSDSSGFAKDNFVRHNSSAGTTGIYVDDGSPLIANNTVRNYSGTAIAVDSGSPTLANNIAAYCGVGIGSSGNPTLRNNCLFDNGTPYSGISAGSGDISADPLFGEDGLHIDASSPCAGAGNNSDVSQGEADIDGEARIYPTNGRVDIGADESAGCGWHIAVSASPAYGWTDGDPVRVTAKLTDDFGNAVTTPQTVSFTVVEGTGTCDPETDVTDSNGQAQTDISAISSGTVEVKASVTDECEDTLEATVAISMYDASNPPVEIDFCLDSTGSMRSGSDHSAVPSVIGFLDEMSSTYGIQFRVGIIRFNEGADGVTDYILGSQERSLSEFTSLTDTKSWLNSYYGPNGGDDDELQLDALHFAAGDMSTHSISSHRYIALITDTTYHEHAGGSVVWKDDVVDELEASGCPVFISLWSDFSSSYADLLNGGMFDPPNTNGTDDPLTGNWRYPLAYLRAQILADLE